MDDKPESLPDIIYDCFGTAGVIVYWAAVLLVIAACVVLAAMAWM